MTRNMPSHSSSFFVYSPTGSDVSSGQEHILLHRFSPAWLQVNDTGLEIALAMDQGMPMDAVAQNLSEKYHISLKAAHTDVSRVARALAEKEFFNRKNLGVFVRKPVLESTYLHITSRCNLSCVQCYAGCGQAHQKEDLPFSLISALLDEMTDQGAGSVIISGGEPLLHPDIRPILKKASEKLTIRLLTNGTLIDRSWADFLSDLNIYIQISIDGPTAEINDPIRGKGSYEKILQAVDYLQAVGLGDRLNFCTTVMNQNLLYLKDIILLGTRIGVPLMRFLPLRRCGMARDNWRDIGSGIHITDHETFYTHVTEMQRTHPSSVDISCGLSGFMLEIPKGFDDDIWCPIGKQLVVDTNGDTYPCVLLMTADFKIGNIYDTGLMQMVQSREMQQICRTLVQRRQLIDKCAACLWQNLCQAGCMGQALDNKGTVLDVDDFCDYRKKAYAWAFNTIIKGT